ncbi:MAG: 23S rRNA (pseudouridine(1915)-N(3))-methyltransferase RlmH [Gammaproteobacteria bacterium]|nr:23S rRNA (pseudouridine(1915)-N(3))-methyltransferase RlmH [Gammaproteobacteria bacterium]
MQIQLINVAQKLPAWVDMACDDYLRRMPREMALKLVTLPLAARKAKQSTQKLQQRESGLIMEKLTPGSLNLALDERGDQWSSNDWSSNLQRWMFEFPRVNLIIGGPDGLSRQCLDACQNRVSLGRMTMPHALVKVVVLEQLYRAWTIIQGHPYHRE